MIFVGVQNIKVRFIGILKFREMFHLNISRVALKVQRVIVNHRCIFQKAVPLFQANVKQVNLFGPVRITKIRMCIYILAREVPLNYPMKNIKEDLKPQLQFGHS